jgi:branched-chain amino acid transport system permease protein
MLLSIVEQILPLAALYSLITLGFATNYALQRFFDLSQGAAFLVGGYLGYQAMGDWGWELLPAFALAAAGAGTFGAIVEISVIHQLRKRKSPSLTFFMATLGVLMVTQNILAIIYGSDTKVYPGDFETPLSLGFIKMSRLDVIQLALAVPLAMTVILVVTKTRFGRRVRAISDSVVLATVIGVPARRVLFGSFVLGSSLSGVAGLLFGLERGMDASSGLFAVLSAIIASIVGGVGSIAGAVLGAICLSVLETTGIVFLPGSWKYTIIFGFLILFLSLRPQGLCGKNYRSA